MELDNKVNIGNVLTVITVIISVCVMTFGVWRELYDKYNVNSTHIVKLESEVVNIKLQAERDRNDIKDDLSDIKEAIGKVSTKLDGKADKGGR